MTGISLPVAADIIVDPENIGATDITDDVGNPLDPTAGVFPNTNVVVGYDSEGELLIDNNSNGGVAIISRGGTIGRNAGSSGLVTINGGPVCR